MAWAPLKYTVPLPGEGRRNIDPTVHKSRRADAYGLFG